MSHPFCSNTASCCAPERRCSRATTPQPNRRLNTPKVPVFAVSCRAAAGRVAGYDARDRDIDLSGVFVEDAELQAASQRFLRARADASWPNRPRGGAERQHGDSTVLLLKETIGNFENFRDGLFFSSFSWSSGSGRRCWVRPVVGRSWVRVRTGFFPPGRRRCAVDAGARRRREARPSTGVAASAPGALVASADRVPCSGRAAPDGHTSPSAGASPRSPSGRLAHPARPRAVTPPPPPQPTRLGQMVRRRPPATHVPAARPLARVLALFLTAAGLCSARSLPPRLL